MKPLFLTAAGIALTSAAFSQTLYDINFQTPDQGINQVVKTGPAPNYISSIWFGTPTVVPAYGPLTDQPLLFDSNGESPIGAGYYYTQIQLGFSSAPLSSLDLSFDMVDTGSGHSMTVFFDTPLVRDFVFSNGQISFLNPLLGPVSVGSYEMGQACHFDIDVNYLLNQWSFSEDNVALGTGAFNPTGNLQSIRFNYSANGPNISGTAIDNVVVVVPEPSSSGPVAFASCAFAGFHFLHRKKRRSGSHAKVLSR